MEPIATYEETRLEGRRSFALYPDRIVVSRRSAAQDFDIPIALRNLSPEVRRAWLRPRVHGLGVGLVILPWCLALLALMTRLAPPSETLVTFPAAVSLVGLVIAAVSWRKVEYACFARRVGTPGVDMARAGRDAHQFDSFVALVVKGIKSAATDAPNRETPYQESFD